MCLFLYKITHSCLLRYNSHSIKFSILKCTIQLFSISTRFCNQHKYPIPAHFHYPPQINYVSMPSHYLFPTTPRTQGTTDLLFNFRVCIFWTFYINGIIQYVAFCVFYVYHLSGSIMFSRFIYHVVSCISILYFIPLFLC